MTQAAIHAGGSGFAGESDLDVLRRFTLWNDAEAFAEIVRRHAAFVFSTCLRVLGDQVRAQDASQETFFRLMTRPHEIRQSVGAWLHRTATHLSVDVLRSEGAGKREIVYDCSRDREASSWSELSPAVDQALSELPEELRVLMVGHFLLGRSQAELAAENKQSPATICRRIQAGLEELRQRLRLKGVEALPAALAGLLGHVSGREAPAALLRELGKMRLYSGATGGNAARGAHRVVRVRWGMKIMAVVIATVGAALLLQVAGVRWIRWMESAAMPIRHLDENQMHHGPAGD